MIGVLLLTAALAAQAPGAAEWIARLGSESFDDRVAAFKALEALGARALTDLRGAADSDDPRIRSRVKVLIESLTREAETDRASRPTLIVLDARDQTLGAVVDAWNERYNLGLMLWPQPAPPGVVMQMRLDPATAARLTELRDRKVTLEAAAPVPFWQAIDRLCAAAGLHYRPLPSAPPGHAKGSYYLYAAAGVRPPASDSGPLRVQVGSVRVAYERDFTRIPEGAPRSVRATYERDAYVALTVLAEPGLSVLPKGPATIDEAEDDAGRSLVPPPPAPATSPIEVGTVAPVRLPRPAFGGNATRLAATLVIPEPAGRAIRRLRGSVPAAVVARERIPIVVSLAEGSALLGKSIAGREATIQVDRVAPGPGQPAFEVTLSRNDHARGTRGALQARPGDIASVWSGSVLDHFDVVDAEGQSLPMIMSQNMHGVDANGSFIRVRLLVQPPGGGLIVGPPRIPAEVRYYDFSQVETVIPFDLRDVPLP